MQPIYHSLFCITPRVSLLNLLGLWYFKKIFNIILWFCLWHLKNNLNYDF